METTMSLEILLLNDLLNTKVIDEDTFSLAFHMITKVDAPVNDPIQESA